MRSGITPSPTALGGLQRRLSRLETLAAVAGGAAAASGGVACSHCGGGGRGGDGNDGGGGRGPVEQAARAGQETAGGAMLLV